MPIFCSRDISDQIFGLVYRHSMREVEKIRQSGARIEEYSICRKYQLQENVEAIQALSDELRVRRGLFS